MKDFTNSAEGLKTYWEKKWFRRTTYIIVTVLFLFIIGQLPFNIIPSGSRGLRFTMGALGNNVLPEGIAFKVPFLQSIEVVTLRPQQIDHQVVVNSDGAITKDNQTVGATVVLFASYQEHNLISMWRNYGEEKLRSIAVKSLIEDFKKTIGQYTIFEIAVNQEKIRAILAEKIRANMAAYPLIITEVKITNYDWSDEFDHQIQATMERAQQVKQKEQELLITEQEAQKQVKQATAQKQATITQAEGEKEAARLMAEAKVLEGEGIRKYNASIAANTEIELKFRTLAIEKIKAERWNGQYVPVNNYTPIPVSSNSGLQPLLK